MLSYDFMYFLIKWEYWIRWPPGSFLVAKSCDLDEVTFNVLFVKVKMPRFMEAQVCVAQKSQAFREQAAPY